jgi:hypothetical protein
VRGEVDREAVGWGGVSADTAMTDLAESPPHPDLLPASGEKEKNYPRPTNGILLAMTVMNSTLASSGRPAM